MRYTSAFTENMCFQSGERVVFFVCAALLMVAHSFVNLYKKRVFLEEMYCEEEDCI